MMGYSTTILWWSRETPKVRLTGGEEHDGLETAVLCGVHVESFELFHLLLEDADVVHEGDHSVRRHGGSMEPRCRQKRRHMQGHGALGRVEHEQLTPDEPQQCHLVRHLCGPTEITPHK